MKKRQTPAQYLKERYGLDPGDMGFEGKFTIEDVERQAKKHDLKPLAEMEMTMEQAEKILGAFMKPEDKKKLNLRQSWEGPKGKEQFFILCQNWKGETLLKLEGWAGSKDCKAMEVAGLEPGTDEDVFTFANHLLRNQFTSFEMIVA